MESDFGCPIVLELVELTRTAVVSRTLERLGFLHRANEFSPQAESFAK
jgi:hypothetical protein